MARFRTEDIEELKRPVRPVESPPNCVVDVHRRRRDFEGGSTLGKMKLSEHRVGVHLVTEHAWDVPLDHSRPGESITVFAREITLGDRGGKDLPWLVFLQGGPGFEATRPMGSFGWVNRAAQEYRVLLIDQRGTGRSTPVDAQSITQRGGPEQQAAYLRLFRADGIVQDCEFVRRALGVERWSVLGQSFGGFCLLHYLTAFPESLNAGFFTGGVPPIDRTPDEIYRATYQRMLTRNEQYFERYPHDVTRVQDILRSA